MKTILSLGTFFLLSIPLCALSGVLDNSFGNNGTIITDLYGLTDVGKNLIVDQQQKIIISGSTAIDKPSRRFFALTRFNQDGSLDKTFDHDGKVTTQDIGPNKSIQGDIGGMDLQDSGKIVAAGRGNFDGKGGLVILRYNEDGSIDQTFGAHGASFVADKQGEVHPLALTIDQAQNVIVAGALHTNNDNSSFIVMRFNRDGELDKSFGDQGYVVTTIAPGHNVVRAVKVDSQQRVVAAGFSGDAQFVVARYLPTGAGDTDFGKDGIATVRFNENGIDTLNALAIQNDDKIVVGGGVQVGAIGGIRTIDFGIARLSSDGTLDPSFNQTGTLILNFVRPAASCLWALTIDVWGNIVAVGDSMAVKGIAIARIRPDGTLDDMFGDGGKQVTPFGSTSHWEGVAIQPDGKIVVGGYVWNGKHYDIGIARFTN